MPHAFELIGMVPAAGEFAGSKTRINLAIVVIMERR